MRSCKRGCHERRVLAVGNSSGIGRTHFLRDFSSVSHKASLVLLLFNSDTVTMQGKTTANMYTEINLFIQKSIYRNQYTTASVYTEKIELRTLSRVGKSWNCIRGTCHLWMRTPVSPLSFSLAVLIYWTLWNGRLRQSH